MLSKRFLPKQTASHFNEVWVFIHGWGASSQVWLPLIERINQTVDVLLLDLPGFEKFDESSGLSPVNLYCEPQRLVQCLEEHLPDHCIVVGWSLGGMLATELAFHCPDRVVGLITLAANGCFVQRENWPAAMEQDVFQRFYSDFMAMPEQTLNRFTLLQSQGDAHRKAVSQRLKQLRPVLSSERSQQQFSTWSKALELLGNLDSRALYRQLACPSLHLFGEKDGLVPSACAQAIANLLPQSGQVEVLPNLGHALHLSEPELIAEKMKAFIRDVGSKYQQDLAESPSSMLSIPTKKQREKKKVADSFSHAAVSYDSVAVLQKMVADKLIARQPKKAKKILDLGCGTGYCSQFNPNHNAEKIGLDLSVGMLQRAQQKQPAQAWVAADMESIPLADNCVDGVISSLSVQWSENLPQLFRELKRIVAPGGWVLFSTLGPDTLNELRKAWQGVNQYVHVNDFVDQKTLLNAIVCSEWDLDFFEQETLVMRYDRVGQLMRALKGVGAHNVNQGRHCGLTPPSQWKKMERAYHAMSDENNQLPATYDVYYVLIRNNDD